jgi:hypothetical protein
MQNYSRVDSIDFRWGNNQRVDVDLFDPALFRH